jgi:hypothetical protein
MELWLRCFDDFAMKLMTGNGEYKIMASTIGMTSLLGLVHVDLLVRRCCQKEGINYTL